jgi:four helix bundle protein
MINQRPHKKLKVWQKAIELVVAIYDVTRMFPENEEFGLRAQMRRASVSVPSNIAEGLTRKSPREKLHFLNIADALLSEIDTQLEIANRVGMLDLER